MLLLAAVAVPGCDRQTAGDPEAALTPEEFAAVIVDLREAEREALGTDSPAAVFARRREEVLARHGTTEAEVRAFVEAPPADLQEVTDLWEDISNRLRRAAPADTL